MSESFHQSLQRKSAETMQVQLLRSMYVGGNYHAAGSVATVGKQDGRQMIAQERAVPYVAPAAPAPVQVGTAAQPEPVAAAVTTSGETETAAQPPADPAPKSRRRKARETEPVAEPAPEPTTPTA